MQRSYCSSHSLSLNFSNKQTGRTWSATNKLWLMRDLYLYVLAWDINSDNLWTFRLVFLCQRQVYVTLPLPFRNMDNSEPPQLRNTSKYAKHLQWSLFNLNSLKSFWLNNEYWAFPEKTHKNNLCALETSLNSPNVLSAPISVSGIDRCNCT